MEYTFKITISACAHHTWQGVLQTETGSHPFMNELELLDAISNQMYLEDMEVFPGKSFPGRRRQRYNRFPESRYHVLSELKNRKWYRPFVNTERPLCLLTFILLLIYLQIMHIL